MITFGDYIKECELFPYSKENYDLIKEASELNLAAMYLENQEFIMENSELAGSCVAGYMVEAADLTTVNDVKEKVSEKKNKWVEKARKVFNRIISAIKSFWNSIVNRFRKISDRCKKLKEDFAVVKLTDEQKDQIKHIVNTAIEESGIPISDDQKEKFSKLPKPLLIFSENGLKNKLAAALCNKKIDLVISKDKFPYAFSESQLKDFFAKVSSTDANKGSKGGLNDIKEIINKVTAKNYKNGITVNKDVEANQAFLKYIEEVEAKFKQRTPDSVDESMRDASAAVGDVSTIFSEALKVSSDSMKLYRTVIAYQEKVISKLESFVKNMAKKS